MLNMLTRKFFVLAVGVGFCWFGTVGSIQSQDGVKAKPSAMRPDCLMCEYLAAPVGLDVAVPRFSWEFRTDGGKATGLSQSAYRIRVARSRSSLDTGDSLVWDSGWVESGVASQIPYDGAALKSDTDYFWTVQIRDNGGNLSAVSKPGHWSSGLFEGFDNAAKWIGTKNVYSRENDGQHHPADPLFRKKFTMSTVGGGARFYIASLGYHEVYLNGIKIGNPVLAPNVSDHRHRARYVAYEVGDKLIAGENTISVALGPGWGIFSYYDTPDRPRLPLFCAQLNRQTAEGSQTVLVSDERWKTGETNRKLLGIWDFGHFGGEEVNVGKENLFSYRGGFNDASWPNATEYRVSLAVSGQRSEPNLLENLRSAVALEEKEPGVWRVDMGANFAGWTEMKVRGKPNATIDFAFSESPHKPMTFRLYSRLILDGNGRGTFTNRFNYSSGRWITVTGLEQKPSLDDFRGWPIRTGYERASHFECSDDLANWIFNTVLWTYENLSAGGFIVDCPQRERMGYGGDAHATSETGLFNYKLGAFYTEWMEDWRDVQGYAPAWFEDGPQPVDGRKEKASAGLLPNTAPTYFGGGGPAWGGIVVVLPWSLYQHYGDVRVLEENFTLITRWLDFLNAYVRDGLLYRYGDEWSFLGDWLWPGAPDGPNSDTADALCLNNIYRIYNLRLAAKIARLLGHNEEAVEWERLADEGRTAVHAEYFHPDDASYFDGRMAIQSAALLAEIPPTELRAEVIKRLETEILVNKSGHIDAGITGGSLLFKSLRTEGRDDLIWSMISQTDYPSWGFMRKLGATTLWEAWELDRPGHSLLHSSYLYPGAWFIDSVLGIRSSLENPGFRRILIRPPQYDAVPLTWAKGDFDAPTGKISVDWRKADGGNFRLKVGLPMNTLGEIFVPSRGRNGVAPPSQATWLRDELGYSVYELPGGDWEFRSKF